MADSKISDLNELAQGGIADADDFVVVDTDADETKKYGYDSLNTDLAADTATLTNKTIDSFTNDVHADDVHMQVRNTSGSAMSFGDVVYINGYNAGQDLPTVALADADQAASATPAIGFVSESGGIGNNANGQVITSGRLSGIDTSAFSAGDSAYLSSTAGGISTKPVGTTDVQKVGIILRSHASLGVIEIVGAGRVNDVPNLADTKFWIGDSNGVPQAFTLSGDVTNTAGGAVTIANNAVSLAKMAGGTDGNLISYDSNGDPVAVATGSADQVLTSNGAGAAPTFQGAAAGGKVAQIVASQDGAVATGTTAMPHDDTIPQNTEGDEYLSVTITPTASDSTLVIDVMTTSDLSVDNFASGAIFQDSTAGALAATTVIGKGGDKATAMVIRHTMAAGTTSATVFKFRAGGASGTFTFNGTAAGRLFGGVNASSMVVTEYTA